MRDVISEQKRQTMLALLERGLVMVHLDPRAEGVDVPGMFCEDPVLRLNIAYGFDLPALEVDDEGIYAVLSFNRRDYGCNLPWDSIFALTLPDDGHEGMVWPGFLPPEMDPFFAQAGIGLHPRESSIRIQAPPRRERTSGGTASTRAVSGGSEARSRFSVIDGGGEESEAEPPTDDGGGHDGGSEDGGDGEDRPRRQRPNLKIVKG
ncbi:MAG: hypothetical protein ACQEXJ_14705 [Myxococcota bacterium]